MKEDLEELRDKVDALEALLAMLLFAFDPIYQGLLSYTEESVATMKRLGLKSKSGDRRIDLALAFLRECQKAKGKSNMTEEVAKVTGEDPLEVLRAFLGIETIREDN